jgi:hypothetical protein
MNQPPIPLDSTMIIFAVTMVFNAGITFANYMYMRSNMVTKDKLRIHLLEMAEELRDTYVRKDECGTMMNSRVNGGSAHGAAAGAD